MFSPLFGLLFAILWQYFAFSVAVRTWNYELLSATVTSSDETKFNSSFTVERKSRGASVLTGTIEWNFDTDDTTEATFILFHSQSGRKDDYTETPYRVKQEKFTKGVNMVYDEIIYKNLKHCSNLERFNQGFVPPFPRKTYVFSQCVPDTNGMPDVLPLGYYKYYLNIRGQQLDIEMSFVVKLKAKF